MIYAFDAKGDFSPTFVSDNIQRLFGYAPSEYLENPDFWRRHVHPEDLQRVEGDASLSKRAARLGPFPKCGSYCWLTTTSTSCVTHGEPDEIVL